MSNKEKSIVIADGFLKKVDCAMRCIENAMRRNKLGLIHMSAAFDAIEKRALVLEIMRMRAEGLTIRKIARTVHLDDKKVSSIIKKGTAQCCCKPCDHGKPCKK